MADFSDLVAGMSALDLQGAQAITMAALKGILRKPWMDGCCGCGAEVPAMATETAARKINVSFEDVLARDGEDGRIVPPSMRSRDEWIREVNKRRGANLIEKFRGLEGKGKDDDDDDGAYCQVTLVENVADDGFGKEVVLYEATSSESDDDESDEDTEVESESESEDEDEGGGAEKIEVIFGSDSEDDDDDDGDDDEEEDGDEDEKEKKEETKGEAKKNDETKEDHTKGEKDSMEYARTFLQSEVGSGFRYPMCQPAMVL